MGLKARMGFGDELTVEALFAPTRFVSADQQDSSSHRVETEGYSPYAACGIEAQLFHIRVTRTVQRIGTRPAEQWPELLQQLGVGQQFVLHLFREGVKFRLELLVKEDCPCHLYSMYLDTYAVKYIKRLERSATKKHPPQTARRVSELILNCLIYIDHAKDAVEIVLRTGGVVKGVRIPVAGGASAKFDPPNLVDDDVLIGGILDGSDKGAGRRIKPVNDATVGVVADQQGAAEHAEVRRRHGESPGLIERFAVDERLHECPIFVEDVDVSAALAILLSKGNVHLAVNVLNSRGSITCRQSRIRERFDELEGAVIDIDFVVGEIGSVDEVARFLVGNRQSCVDGTGAGVVHADERVVRRKVRPAADGAGESGEHEERSPVVDLKFRRPLVHDARRRTDAGAGCGRNGDDETLLDSAAVIERREARALIAEPKWSARAISQSPGIDELLVALLTGIFDESRQRIRLAANGPSHVRGKRQRQENQGGENEVVAEIPVNPVIHGETLLETNLMAAWTNATPARAVER